MRRLLLHGCHRRGLASARCLSLPLRPRAPLPRRQPHDTSLPWKWRGGGGGGGERGGQAGGAEPPPRQRRYRSAPPRRCSRGARPRGAPRRGTAAHHRRAPAAERPAAGTLCPPRSSPLRSARRGPARLVPPPPAGVTAAPAGPGETIRAPATGASLPRCPPPLPPRGYRPQPRGASLKPLGCCFPAAGREKSWGGGAVKIKKREGSTVVLLVNVSWPPQLRRPQGRAEAAPPLPSRATSAASDRRWLSRAVRECPLAQCGASQPVSS